MVAPGDGAGPFGGEFGGIGAPPFGVKSRKTKNQGNFAARFLKNKSAPRHGTRQAGLRRIINRENGEVRLMLDNQAAFAMLI